MSIVGFVFFISSLLPLWTCTAIAYWDICWLKITSFSLIGLSLIFMLTFLIVVLNRKNTKMPSVNYKNIRTNRALPIDMLFGYVLPFIAFDLTVTKQAICFLIILLVYMVIYLRNKTYYSNILFYIAGYKAFYCTDVNGKEIMAISKGKWASMTSSDVTQIRLAGDTVFIINHST